MNNLSKDILNQVDKIGASERDRFLIRVLENGRYFADEGSYQVLQFIGDSEVVRARLRCIYDGVTEYSVVYKKSYNGQLDEFIEFEGTFEH